MKPSFIQTLLNGFKDSGRRIAAIRVNDAISPNKIAGIMENLTKYSAETANIAENKNPNLRFEGNWITSIVLSAQIMWSMIMRFCQGILIGKCAEFLNEYQHRLFWVLL